MILESGSPTHEDLQISEQVVEMALTFLCSTVDSDDQAVRVLSVASNYLNSAEAMFRLGQMRALRSDKQNRAAKTENQAGEPA